MLRRRFSAVWIAENARDLMGQANVEYAEWLEHNPPARNPVGWLLTCAYRRAQNLLDSQARKPTPASLDTVFHLADESIPTPEQQVLNHDRQERLRAALNHLPEKERKLLALVYFGDHSIRAAGRKLGWQKSAADRHHSAAMKKLRALVGEDRSLLSPATLGLVAWSLAYSEGRGNARAALDAALTPSREAVAVSTETGTRVAHQLAELWRRLSPATDPAGAAATSGGGRLLGACGVAAATVVCGLAASGVVLEGGGGVSVDSATPVAAPQRANAPRQSLAPLLPAPALPAPGSPTRPIEKVESSKAPLPDPGQPRKRARPRAAPSATHQQIEGDFGIGGRTGPASELPPTPEPSRSARPTEASPPPPSSGSAPSGSSSGSASAREFGL